MRNQAGAFLLSLAATASKFSQRPSQLLGIDTEAEPVVALAFDLAAAFRLQQAENEWNAELFGDKPKQTEGNVEYW